MLIAPRHRCRRAAHPLPRPRSPARHRRRRASDGDRHRRSASSRTDATIRRRACRKSGKCFERPCASWL